MEDKVLKLLGELKLFEDIANDEARLHSVATILKRKKVKAGDMIIAEGQTGDSLYIIKSGSVRVLKNTLQDEKYTVIILSANEKVFFGELAIVDNDQRSASVMAESDCELLVLTRSKFEQLAEKDPYLGYKIVRRIARIISDRLRKANKDIITLFEALVHEVEGEEKKLG